MVLLEQQEGRLGRQSGDSIALPSAMSRPTSRLPQEWGPQRALRETAGSLRLGWPRTQNHWYHRPMGIVRAKGQSARRPALMRLSSPIGNATMTEDDDKLLTINLNFLGTPIEADYIDRLL